MSAAVILAALRGSPSERNWHQRRIPAELVQAQASNFPAARPPLDMMVHHGELQDR